MRNFVLALGLVSFAQVASADISIVDNNQELTVDCAKDPTVSVSGNKATLTLTGTCKLVSLNGNHAKVTGSAAKIMINGNHNTAVIDAVDQLLVTGNDNTASYKRTAGPTTKRTKVGNVGKRNKVTKVK